MMLKSDSIDRRQFIERVAKTTTAMGVIVSACALDTPANESELNESSAAALPFNISLAQWSLHRTYFGAAVARDNFEQLLASEPDSVLQGELDAIEFPVLARREFGLDAVEYVNTFFFGKAENKDYLTDLKTRADSEGVTSLLIMCDSEGRLGDPDTAERERSIQRHLKWLDAASFLGCHSVRVNAASEGTYEEQAKLAADGLYALAEQGHARGLNVLVENHGGASSNGMWLAGVMERVDHPSIGTLPDFGNFLVSEGEFYDRYQGVQELMPYARAVSAKSHDFESDGRESHTDYARMIRLVLDAGYRGYIGIEYEGDSMSEFDGIRATKKLLEGTRQRLASEYA